MLFKPLKVFIPVSFGFLLLGGVKAGLDLYVAYMKNALDLMLINEPVISTTAVIMLLGGLQLLLIGMMSDGIARKIAQRIPSTYKTRAVKSYIDRK